MNTHEIDLPRRVDPRWLENRLEARGLSGLGRRISVRARAMIHHHFGGPDADQCGILVYRRLAPALPGVAKPTLSVTPERFREQLTGLLDRGRVFWPLQKVLEFNRRQWRVMPWITTLSFDIGFAGLHSYALPILRDLNIPATVFLDDHHFSQESMFPTDDWARRTRDQAPDDVYRPLNASECRELVKSGLISLGSLSRSGTSTTDGSLVFDHELAKGVDGLDWTRVHVASWDTSNTLASRLNHFADSRRTHSDVAVRRLDSNPTANGAHLASSADSPKHTVTLCPSNEAAPGGNGEVKRPAVDISVIVPTYNRAHWIEEALQSLIDQETDDGFSFDIHIVDNASSDATAAVIAKVAAASSIRVVYHRQEIPGDAPTRNVGVAGSTGAWLAFFDDDQLAEPAWLRKLWSATSDGDRPVIGGAVHLHMNDRELAELDPLCRAALRETRLYPNARPYHRNDLPGTGNALVARRVFDAIGKFDEAMTGGGSDCDFFTRARDAGYPLWYSPEAVIRHRVPAERLTPEFLRWDALSGGAEHAGYFDFRRKGLTALLGLCGARLVQALIIHLPLLLWAQLLGDTQAILGRKTSLWRTEGYVRRTLSIIAPVRFAQPRFFESLDLRHGRSICG